MRGGARFFPRHGAWARLDAAGRAVLGGGLLVAGVCLVGGQLGAWPATSFALVVLIAALMAAAAAAAPVGWRERPGSPWPGLEIAGGLVAAALAGLHLLEVAIDLAGGRASPPVGVVPAAVLAVSSGGVAAAAGRRAPQPRASLAAWIVAVGVALVLAGVALGLGLGDRSLGQLTALTVAATVGAAVVAVVGSGRSGAAAALSLAVFGSLAFWALAGAFGRGNFGRADQLFFALHLAGLALVLAGCARSALTGPARTP